MSDDLQELICISKPICERYVEDYLSRFPEEVSSSPNLRDDERLMSMINAAHEIFRPENVDDLQEEKKIKYELSTYAIGIFATYLAKIKKKNFKSDTGENTNTLTNLKTNIIKVYKKRYGDEEEKLPLLIQQFEYLDISEEFHKHGSILFDEVVKVGALTKKHLK
jgi:hypothetical protein